MWLFWKVKALYCLQLYFLVPLIQMEDFVDFGSHHIHKKSDETLCMFAGCLTLHGTVQTVHVVVLKINFSKALSQNPGS